MGKLTAKAVANAGPGRHADGDGLYLFVKDMGSRSWLLRVQYNKKRRDIGLGSLSDLTLAEAREQAARLRRVARAGGDPVAERDKDKKEFEVPTFKRAAVLCHEAQKAGWSDRHAGAWLASLQQHAFAKLGSRIVDTIEAGDIRDALAPIWLKKPVIARQVRQRIGTVLNYCRAEGWRATEAPVGMVRARLADAGALFRPAGDDRARAVSRNGSGNG